MDRLKRQAAAKALEHVSDGMKLFREGEQALKDSNPQRAVQLFRQAYTLKSELD